MNTPARRDRPRATTLALWFVAAVASTMCGIGGGLFAVPILHFLCGVELKLATATSLVVVFAMTAAGTLAELSSAAPQLEWRVIGLLCAGGLLGAHLGQRVARRLDTRVLTWILALALFAAGVRVLWGGPPPQSGAFDVDAALEDPQRQFGVIAAGFVGGFVAPLLGIGGGLIVVPALYLGLPGLGYLAARACSTAMSAALAAQLTWLNLRDGRVHRASVMPFALVAVAGAIVGIALVHQPGFAEAARVLLGVLLCAIGVKYAVTAKRRRA